MSTLMLNEALEMYSYGDQERQDKFQVVLDGSTFQALFIADGAVNIKWAGGEEPVSAGASLLIPAALGEYEILPETAGATVLRTTIPAD